MYPLFELLIGYDLISELQKLVKITLLYKIFELFFINLKQFFILSLDSISHLESNIIVLNVSSKLYMRDLVVGVFIKYPSDFSFPPHFKFVGILTIACELLEIFGVIPCYLFWILHYGIL